MAERLIEDIFTALDEQTVVVAGTGAAATIVPGLAAQLRAHLTQRAALERQIADLLEAHPLSKLLTSMPGIGVRTGTRILIDVGDAQHLRHLRPPRGLRRAGPRLPHLRLLHPRRTTLPTRKQTAQTRLLPRRVRLPRRPGLPHLLRPQTRPGQNPHPSSPLPRPTPHRRPVRHAPRRHLLRITTRSGRLTWNARPVSLYGEDTCTRGHATATSGGST